MQPGPVPRPVQSQPADSGELRSKAIAHTVTPWQILRIGLTGLLFLFGDVELGSARAHRRAASRTNPTIQTLNRIVIHSTKHSVIGAVFIFGDIELGLQKLPKSRPKISKQTITDVSICFGVLALFIRSLVEVLFGTERSEAERTNERPDG